MLDLTKYTVQRIPQTKLSGTYEDIIAIMIRLIIPYYYSYHGQTKLRVLRDGGQNYHTYTCSSKADIFDQVYSKNLSQCTISMNTYTNTGVNINDERLYNVRGFNIRIICEDSTVAIHVCDVLNEAIATDALPKNSLLICNKNNIDLYYLLGRSIQMASPESFHMHKFKQLQWVQLGLMNKVNVILQSANAGAVVDYSVLDPGNSEIMMPLLEYTWEFDYTADISIGEILRYSIMDLQQLIPSYNLVPSYYDETAIQHAIIRDAYRVIEATYDMHMEVTQLSGKMVRTMQNRVQRLENVLLIKRKWTLDQTIAYIRIYYSTLKGITPTYLSAAKLALELNLRLKQPLSREQFIRVINGVNKVSGSKLKFTNQTIVSLLHLTDEENAQVGLNLQGEAQTIINRNANSLEKKLHDFECKYAAACECICDNNSMHYEYYAGRHGIKADVLRKYLTAHNVRFNKKADNNVVPPSIEMLNYQVERQQIIDTYALKKENNLSNLKSRTAVGIPPCLSSAKSYADSFITYLANDFSVDEITAKLAELNDAEVAFAMQRIASYALGCISGMPGSVVDDILTIIASAKGKGYKLSVTNAINDIFPEQFVFLNTGRVEVAFRKVCAQFNNAISESFHKYMNYMIHCNDDTIAILNNESIIRKGILLTKLATLSDKEMVQVLMMVVSDKMKSFHMDFGYLLVSRLFCINSVMEDDNPGSMTADQKRAMDILVSGKNVLLSGDAGTGKSYLLQLYLKHASAIGKKALICASTGIAADHISGMTAHKAFKIPCRTIGPNDCSGVEPTQAVKEADIIVIDEISMLRADAMQFVLSQIKEAGNKQVILLGDFHQLQPVITAKDKEKLDNLWCKDFGKGFAFEAPLFDEFDFESVMLTEVVRQADKKFAKQLSKLRKGDNSTRVLNYFNQNSSRTQMRNAIWLCDTNAEVDKRNKEALDSFENKKLYPANVVGNVASFDFNIGNLELAVGMQVMILKNDKFMRYQNGSIGTIVKMTKHAIFICLDKNMLIVKIERQKYKGSDDDDAYVEQFPISLAYASTIHKSQGQSLSAINISIQHNADHQRDALVYVALSRCTSIKNVYIKGKLQKNDISASEEVKDFYRRLEQKTHFE